MSVKTKLTFLLLVAMVGLFVSFAGTCGEGGEDVTWGSIVEGEKQNWGEVADSLKVSPKVNAWGSDTGKALCIAQGKTWVASISVCKD